jgi:CDP-paratose 2-epimerase
MKILITGGAGFIGCNTVKYFAGKGHNVFVIDNLSRETARVNLLWLQENNIPFQFTKLDVRHMNDLEAYFRQHVFDVVIHLAAQVAVTLSVQDPRYDFEVNAQGTFNVLECVRKYCPAAVFINASTNKVYGKAADKLIIEKEDCYAYQDDACCGINENQCLEFYSPYGCSKGVADQYTLDYARVYGLKTISVRQSCIYGPHQLGIEDQGWIAWFIIAHLTGKPITVYGDGKQVRDVLYVQDLVMFYETLINDIERVKGNAFNMGGGMDKALSLMQFFKILEDISGHPVDFTYSDWRPGDQCVFISDNSKARTLCNFSPKITHRDGIEKIYHWLYDFYLHKTASSLKHEHVLRL